MSSIELLKIRPKDECRYDLVSLGEIMLRLDPGEGRIRTSRLLRASEGGGEYNVARGLRRCFEQRTAVVTAFARNEVGLLLEDLVLQGGVDTSLIQWAPYGGIGKTVRNGLNFTERGFGLRGAVGCSDRGYTAASQLQEGDVAWDRLFGDTGVRWFHTGGIYAGLSETTPGIILEAVKSAKRYGTVVSYDLNYRPSLWKSIGGKKRAQEVNCEIAEYVDVMIGNEEDYTACLGFDVSGFDNDLSQVETAAYKEMIGTVVKKYENFKVVATTLRTVRTATRNDWGAICWTDGNFYEANYRKDVEILDRVGGGDSFASGLIYGLMELGDPQLAVEYGAAHGVLAMTTPGDTSIAIAFDVERLVGAHSPRVDR